MKQSHKIALFELALAGGLLYYTTQKEQNKTLIYIASAYLLLGAYMNYKGRVKIT
jgi:hypothetical protein|tara:strand:+ start:428 stop:592 length:165 start_codon:yes stop_codon:yes gene_type:complete